MVSKSSLTVQDHRERVSRSVSLLRCLHHPHIHHILRLMETPAAVFVFSELATDDMLSLLRQRGQLPSALARNYLGQLLSALSHCHGMGLIHRNVKLEHVLIMADGTLKLCGFGFANDFGAASLCATVTDSPHYVAPEIIAGTAAFALDGGKIDVWSLGCVLYAMLTGRLPFIHTELEALCHMICQQPYAEPESLEQGARLLLQGMLAKSPAARLSLAAVCAHPWSQPSVCLSPCSSATRIPPSQILGRAQTGAAYRSLRPSTPNPLTAPVSAASTTTFSSSSSAALFDITFEAASLRKRVCEDMLAAGFSAADVERAAAMRQCCDDASAAYELFLHKHRQQGAVEQRVPEAVELPAEADSEQPPNVTPSMAAFGAGTKQENGTAPIYPSMKVDAGMPPRMSAIRSRPRCDFAQVPTMAASQSSSPVMSASRPCAAPRPSRTPSTAAASDDAGSELSPTEAGTVYEWSALALLPAAEAIKSRSASEASLHLRVNSSSTSKNNNHTMQSLTAADMDSWDCKSGRGFSSDGPAAKRSRRMPQSSDAMSSKWQTVRRLFGRSAAAVLMQSGGGTTCRDSPLPAP